ncbi:hypothetical protein NUU61_003840 [Penicillium alfredii]|uniref:M-phase inducer phosphatase n=1 Tax=Penicillium alfredii TaxID=1506179 RepID=A0A9W9FJZ4_9EURO|nr:uncharacterized protein NUU61_003840 [Penicillium alfredii]KAJ5101618.1 hypothetical protein NUU61_003840 [Penicillium alfredii]
MIMEHSSPLAAMQPPSMLLGHCLRPDTSYPSLCSVTGVTSNSFNFRDLSMKKSGPDYFSMNPPSGIFPDSQFGGRLPAAGNASSVFVLVETCDDDPPLPSSSPAPGMDFMEMSPLPHKKPAFVVTAELEVHSPTPESTRVNSPATSAAPSPLLESPIEAPERKRPAFLRPTLAKSKAQSFQLGMTRPAPESKAPPFRFGAKTSLSTSTSLEDVFNDSPPRDRHHSRNSSGNIALPRLRPPFHHARSSASPAPSSIRKHSHPLMRPRKQCRRSLSMFAHPADVIADKEAKVTTNAPLQSISDMESPPSPQLPHFIPEDQADNLPRIDKSTLVDVLNGNYNDRFDNIMIIDCRFEYEYEGGHINGATNYNDKEHLSTQLFGIPQSRTALILHCEYSAHRAPIMAKYIRHQDRAVNVDTYPYLTYPDLYILDGGYSSFFAEHRSLCFPRTMSR